MISFQFGLILWSGVMLCLGFAAGAVVGWRRSERWWLHAILGRSSAPCRKEIRRVQHL